MALLQNKYWKLFWHFRKIQLMKMIEYRGDFFFWLIVSLMWTAFNYFFFYLIFGNAKTIAGWTLDELMVVLSFFTMIDALTWSVFWPNMSHYTEDVFSGKLSKYLLQPANSIFLLTTEHVTYHNIPRFFIGLIILILTALKMDVSVSFVQLLTIVTLFITSVIFLYSGWFILATCSFWVEKLQNINEIMPGFRRIYQVPRQVYTGVTAITISFIFPVGLVTSLPSEVLLRTTPWGLVLYFICFTALFAFLAISFFRISIRKYSSVGG